MKLEDLGLNDEQLATVSKLIQAEGDRVRTEKTKEIKALQDELSELKPVEKSPEEIALDERIKALEDKENEIANKEKQSQIKAKFKSEGIDEQLVKFINLQGVEDIDTHIQEFAGMLNKVTLGNSYKPNEHKGNKDVVTVEQFANMGYRERVQLEKTNPTLYNKLAEQ